MEFIKLFYKNVYILYLYTFCTTNLITTSIYTYFYILLKFINSSTWSSIIRDFFATFVLNLQTKMSMKKRIVTIAAIFCLALSMHAESSTGISYNQAKHAPAMRWTCPEIEKYQSLFLSLKNDDYKIYANNVKDKIELYSNPEQPSDKYLVTQAILTIKNPLFRTENLLNHIAAWIKSNKKDWVNNMKINVEDKSIVSDASIHVASHSTFVGVYKVSVTPHLVISLIEDNKLLVSFSANRYSNGEYDSYNKLRCTVTDKVSDVYPFVPKSSYKITYAKAYVGTYLYFWNFISDLCTELDANFTKDPVMLSQLHYQYAQDSLKTMYGEPTKIIADQTSMPDVHKELRFYEGAKKFVFMNKTIDFKDIMSCEIVDDPKFIPGRTTSYGLGISLFGIGIGGSDSYTTPDKTIHSYVVNVKIDNMSAPLIYIATGQNEQKANEIAAVFEYILRHQDRPKTSAKQKTRTVTRRRK